MRLNRYIAFNSNYSRREADELIFSGHVTVNGKPVLIPAYEVKEEDKVAVLGKLIESSDFLYVKFYKPRGILTAYGDPHGRKNLNDFEFFKKTKLAYSGRLDKDSEGLIFFSNDGNIINRLQTPKYNVEKEYIVYTSRPLSDDEKNALEDGLVVDGFRFRECKVDKIGRNKYNVIITEGKKRQIRIMFKHFKIEVERLIRIRIGNIKIGDLKPGEFKFLTKRELEELKKCLNLE
ncbi:MAG: rRNA pseudouridine synthase [Calditerrivibrio sp.]|nr:rRNA pseudouridine synthase [Calditerrivibrio sp.]